MALVRIEKNPSPKDLRWFGVLFGAFFGIAGLLAWRRHGDANVARVLWAVGLVVPIAYYAIPRLRRPIYVGWMYLVFPIGLAVSYAVMALVYFAIVTPIGLAMRLAGRDPLERASDPDRKSYWVEHRTGDDPSRYLQQY